MKIILTQPVTGLGEAGDVVDVKDGYARNFLLPRKVATPWTKGGQKQVDSIKAGREKRAMRSAEDAAAACYQRGIRFIQVPTTLLAAVDSSVGGKTAIDLKAGKNLAGAFWQPSFVLCDIDCLDTLPEEIFRDGCAEIIKTAVLFDEPLFMELVRDGLRFDRERVIAACVRHKRGIVAADEFDRGQRNLLNLGHTFGHAVELLSDFTLSHGRAVAIGTAIAGRAAVSLGLCDQGTATRIMWLLERFGLPVFTPHSALALCEAAISDKKRSGDTINLILPKRIGECTIRPTPVSALEELIQAGL